jgi:hypothetical protein
MYGYESSAALTTDILLYILQTRPLVREGALRRRAKLLSGKRKEKRKIWSWASKGPWALGLKPDMGLMTMGLKPDTKKDRPTDRRS